MLQLLKGKNKRKMFLVLSNVCNHYMKIISRMNIVMLKMFLTRIPILYEQLIILKVYKTKTSLIDRCINLNVPPQSPRQKRLLKELRDLDRNKHECISVFPSQTR